MNDKLHSFISSYPAYIDSPKKVRGVFKDFLESLESTGILPREKYIYGTLVFWYQSEGRWLSDSINAFVNVDYLNQEEEDNLKYMIYNLLRYFNYTADLSMNNESKIPTIMDYLFKKVIDNIPLDQLIVEFKPYVSKDNERNFAEISVERDFKEFYQGGNSYKEPSNSTKLIFEIPTPQRDEQNNNFKFCGFNLEEYVEKNFHLLINKLIVDLDDRIRLDKINSNKMTFNDIKLKDNMSIIYRHLLEDLVRRENGYKEHFVKVLYGISHLFLDRDGYNSKIRLYMIPSTFTIGGNRYGNVALYLVTSGEAEFSELRNIQNFLQNFAIKITASELALAMRKHALKSAVGAIMGRNMSHNIGSHVIYYTRMTDFNKIARIIRYNKRNKIENFTDGIIFLLFLGKLFDKILENKLSNKGYKKEVGIEKIDFFKDENIRVMYSFYRELIPGEDINNEEEFKEQIVKPLASRFMTLNIQGGVKWRLVEWGEEIKIFLEYLQRRMDFIAMIITEWPNWYYPIYLGREVIRGFLKIRPLLDGIALSEGVRGYYYDWETETEENVPIKFEIIRKEGANTKKILLSEKGINQSEDIEISIRGGTIGLQAFYSILENIIRNAAKHNRENIARELKITIELEDEGPEFWILRVYDNISKVNNDNKLDQKINRILSDEIVNFSGYLSKKYWGIKEIKICSTFLQGKSIDALLDTRLYGYKKGVQEFVIRAIHTGYNTLGYEFKVPKPKTVGIICSPHDELCDELKKWSPIWISDRFDNLSFEFLVILDSDDLRSKNSLLKLLTNQGDEATMNNLKEEVEKYPYRLFLVIDGEKQQQKFTKILNNPFLKERICLLNREEFKEILNGGEYSKLILKRLNGGASNDVEIDPYRRFILNLYSRWILHITQDLRSEKQNFVVRNSKNTEPFYEPITSPSFNLTKNEDKEKYRIEANGMTIEYTYDESSMKGNNKFLIMFDRHDPPKESLPQDVLYHHSYSGSQIQFFIISNNSEQDFQILSKIFLFVENAVFGKLIFDERFFRFFNNTSNEVQKRLLYSGIFPVKEIAVNGKTLTIDGRRKETHRAVIINCNKETCNKETDKLQSLDFREITQISDINENILRSKKWILIIHHTLLENGLGYSRKNIEGFISDIKECFPFIIITSGRGTPPNIALNAKFIGFSEVEKLIREYPEDIIFTKLAMSIVQEEGERNGRYDG